MNKEIKLYFPEITKKKSEEIKQYRIDNECKHSKQQLSKRTFHTGTIQYVFQCLDCGNACSKAIKTEEAIKMGEGFIANFDNDLLEKQNKKYQDGIDYINKKYQLLEENEIRLRKNKEDKFFQDYSKYLNSKEWEKKRQKVLKRANFICESCLENKATEVHHLTYDHVFNEPLFDLVAICNPCHNILHPEEDKEGN